LADAFAREIGVDGCAPDASRTVRLARSLMGSWDVTAREGSGCGDWVGKQMCPAMVAGMDLQLVFEEMKRHEDRSKRRKPPHTIR
jgi:hypothetical protein